MQAGGQGDVNVKVAAYERGEVKAPRELDELAGVLIRERGALDDRIGVLSRQLSSRKMQAVVLGAAMVAAVVVASRVGSVAASNETKLLTAASENTSLQATNRALSSKVDELTKQKATLEADVRSATSARNESEARAGKLLSIVGLGDAPMPIDRLDEFRGATVGLDRKSAQDLLTALLQKAETSTTFAAAGQAYLLAGESRFLVVPTADGLRLQCDGGASSSDLPKASVGTEPVAIAARGPLVVASRTDGSVALFDARHPGGLRTLTGATSRVGRLAIGREVDGWTAVVGIGDDHRCHRWAVGADSGADIASADVADVAADVTSIFIGSRRVALLARSSIRILPAFAPGAIGGSAKDRDDWAARRFEGGNTAMADWSPDESLLVVTQPGRGLEILQVADPASVTSTVPSWPTQTDKSAIVGAWFTSPTTLLLQRQRLEHWVIDPARPSSARRGDVVDCGLDASQTSVCLASGSGGATVAVIATSGEVPNLRTTVTRWLLGGDGTAVFAGAHTIAAPFAAVPMQAQLGPDLATVLVCSADRGYRVHFGEPAIGEDPSASLARWIENAKSARVVW